MQPIYLDYNATTPIDPEVAGAMLPFLSDRFGNPSSGHWFGVQAKKAVEKARAQVAALLNCQADEIIFTSGGSESNNYAIKGTVWALQHKGNHIITSQIEHPAVLEVCSFLEQCGFEVTYLPVDIYGRVDLQAAAAAFRPTTILMTIMHANNEVGTIQPIAELAALAKQNGVVFHCDAAQSVGKIETDVQKMGVDLLSVAGHKLYAPKGIGALFIRRGTQLSKQMHGANHEQNWRAGTENVLEISGLGQACVMAKRDAAENDAHLKTMRDLLHQQLLAQLPDLHLNGHPEYRLPNTLSVGFPHIDANLLLEELREVAASAGAACHTDDEDTSGVLVAMKVPSEFAMGTIRFSTGRYTTSEEIDQAVPRIVAAVKRIRGEASQSQQISADEIQLTHFTQGLGCACKVRPQILEKVLRDFPLPINPNVLVGTETFDDAAVYRIDDEKAVILNVDFLTPLVDDPFQFGAIAAANALSDIYAMGGKPLFALNIVCFPSNRLPVETLQQILAGANAKAAEAGIPILGGHTVDDPEPKFGLAVVGIIQNDQVLKNTGAIPGDALVLTHPIGTGIVTSALKRGLASSESVRQAVEIMGSLNNQALDIGRQFSLHACTDVTGFGLLGHLREMLSERNVTAEVIQPWVPIIDGVYPLAAANIIPGGTQNNYHYVENDVQWAENIAQIDRWILCDAQTSGGLLFALPQNEAVACCEQLQQAGMSQAAIIGHITDKQAPLIKVFSASKK